MVECDGSEKDLQPQQSSWCGVTRPAHFSGPAALLMVSLTEASLPSAAKLNKEPVPLESAASTWQIWWIIESHWPWQIRALYQLSLLDYWVRAKQLRHYGKQSKARSGAKKKEALWEKNPTTGCLDLTWSIGVQIKVFFWLIGIVVEEYTSDPLIILMGLPKEAVDRQWKLANMLGCMKFKKAMANMWILSMDCTQ